ncbi:MAG TPA: FtsX-like permease family protein [Gaiellaceae bacterium]|nr:FtsX-like permease family protein [Gaiellaceae bacterium]
MSWASLVAKNLRRRLARTVFTAIGVGVGVALIVALFAITNGVHRTADDLTHVGRADFGLYQSGVSDFTQSLLPNSLATKVAGDPQVAAVAKVKLLVTGGMLVFGLDPHEFAYRRLVVVAGHRSLAMAGDHSTKHVGQTVRIGSRTFTIGGIFHSGDRFEDLGVELPLRTVEALAQRPGEATSIGVDVKLGANPKVVARRLEERYPGIAAITEPGQAIKIDTSSRLILSTGWIVSVLALIVGGIAVTNTMAMSVYERTREIGILRAIGWPVSRVGALVVSEALGICLLALGVGCGLGVLAANVFVARSELNELITPTYSLSTFLWGLLFALGVGLVGALYPTWRAVTLAPVAALRHE